MSRDPYTHRKRLLSLYQENLKVIHQEKGTNAGLWLDKYSKDQDRADTGDQERRENKEQNRAKTSNRSALVAEVASISIPAVYTEHYMRWVQILEDVGVTQKQMRFATVKGRMIIGLGDESVLETSITLHRTYGVPYIPGSALKGLAASYARQRLGPKWQRDQEAYKVVFGTAKEAGYITFFDALLVVEPDETNPRPVLYQDTITVHHPDYYQGKGEENTAPSDWDSPTPIPFLSATGTYLVALAAPDLEEKEEWINKTFEILEYALEEMGIGAKTSSGYGRMTLKMIEEKVEN